MFFELMDLYMLIGLANAAWFDIQQMRKPVPYCGFPRLPGGRWRLRVMVVLVNITFWLPIVVETTSVRARRFLAAKAVVKGRE